MTPHPSGIRRWTALAALAALFCVLTGSVDARRDTDVPKNADARTIAHVMNRIAFGARPGDIERVQKMGLAAYVNQQLHPEQIADEALTARLASFTTLTMTSNELAENFFLPALELRRDQQLRQQRAEAEAKAKAQADEMMAAGGTQPARPNDLLTPEQRQIQQGQQNVVNELMQAKILRATLSERQLEEVLVDFWFNHFNVFVGKGQVRQYLTEYERDAIRPYVLGKFRDMVGATAHSPAMLFYLDNFQSQAPAGAMVLAAQPNRIEDLRRNPRQPITRPGQARPGQVRPGQVRPGQPQPGQLPRPPQRQRPGLNENYARELMELHTLGVDGGYTQKDVQELARILTGWTIDRPQQGGQFLFRPQAHDAGEKVLLGTKFPAGRGEDEGERALDILARHPSTAHHIAFKLAQRFVADAPPKALVDRAAKKFLDTKGDLREVTRLIITSPEFFAADAYHAKVKTPLEFVVSAARAVDANIVNAQSVIQALRTDLGMPLYGCQPPTGYSMTADAWVNTGALLNRMNFAVQLVSGGQPQRMDARGRIGQPGRPNDQLPGQGRQGQPPRPLQLRPGQPARMPIQVDMNALAPDTSEATRDGLIKSLLSGEASEATRATLARADNPQNLVALTLGSPEFQRR